MEIGIARAVGAVLFSVVIGLLMHFVFRGGKQEKARVAATLPEPSVKRPLYQNALFFASMVAILVFANWGRPAQVGGLSSAVHSAKWAITAASAVGLGAILAAWFGMRWWKPTLAAIPVAALALVLPRQPMVVFAVGAIGLSIAAATDGGESGEWFGSTWGFAKQILPLLLLGVLVSGALLGRPGAEGLIPSSWVQHAVGGNSLGANFFASVAGAFMYFATLTEVPILQGLTTSGMGKGPALALLLAGPALSLPSMLVLRMLIGMKKTVVFVSLVVVLSTITGMIFGALFG